MHDRVRRKAGQVFLMLFFCLILVRLLLCFTGPAAEGSAFHARSGTGHTSEWMIPEGPVYVNTAGPDELTELFGIGPVLAENWVREREANGFFFYPEDLLSIRGIGPGKLEKIRNALNFSLPEK